MLYDPRWERPARPDIFSLDGLIAWLETKPTTKEYQYTSVRRCLLAQYFRARGYRGVRMYTEDFLHRGWFFLKSHPLPEHFNLIAMCGDQTFGAALRRAKLLRDHPEYARP